MDSLKLLPGPLKKINRLPDTGLNLPYHFSHEATEHDKVAGQAGLEPATTGFGVRRSNQLELLTPIRLTATTLFLCAGYGSDRKDRTS